MQAFFEKFATPVQYVVHGGDGTLIAVKAFVRGVKSEDLFAEAMQQDQVATVDAAKFLQQTGQATPRRLDRMKTNNGSFSVEAWRGAPNAGPPTFFKLLLRGGQQ